MMFRKEPRNKKEIKRLLESDEYISLKQGMDKYSLTSDEIEKETVREMLNSYLKDKDFRFLIDFLVLDNGGWSELDSISDKEIITNAYEEALDSGAVFTEEQEMQQYDMFTNTKKEEPKLEYAVYISYLNKDKGFKADQKHFNSYDEAVTWGRKEFGSKFNSDMISYSVSENEDEIRELDHEINSLEELKNIMLDDEDSIIDIDIELIALKELKKLMSADILRNGGGIGVAKLKDNGSLVKTSKDESGELNGYYSEGLEFLNW
jgi:hypothetical protein